MAKLRKFEGRDVIATSIAVTNAGDGLSEALAIDPVEFAIGDKVYVVLETEVTKVSHTPVRAEQRKRIEEAKGNIELPFEGEGDG